MNHPSRAHRYGFLAFTLAWSAAAWGGCATSNGENTTATSSSSSSSSSGNGGSGGEGGGINMTGGAGGTGGGGDGGACVTTNAKAGRVPLDIFFVVDRSGSMAGPKWVGTTAALTSFFNDQGSYGISAGMAYFPTTKPDQCNPTDYAQLDVPVGQLPGNAFALTNSIPSDPLGWGTPTYSALKGVLMAATARQDAYPSHKVIVVIATDGEPFDCLPWTNQEIAGLAQSARNYNGVKTYAIAVQGATLVGLQLIAEAGGTTAFYDVTQDINKFAEKMAEIRQEALACDFEIPAPPGGEEINPEEVNFTYTPKGMGKPKIVPRADDLADCKNAAGWYFDNNISPTKIVLCPASCSTVQADINAEVSALFGCKSIPN